MPNDPKKERGSAGIAPAPPCQSRDLRRVLSLEGKGLPVEVTEDHILSILCVRRGREALMGRELFSDPAWDILLELYAARLGSRRMTVCELCRSIDTPQSTVMRWIAVLSSRGLVNTFTDFGDTTKSWVELSIEGDAAMTRLVDRWGSAFRSI